jgi:uncharacterized protein
MTVRPTGQTALAREAAKRSQTKSNSEGAFPPPFEVRHSPIHGRGVYALRTIPKGTRIMEYKGDLITWDEVWERYPYEEDEAAQNHTFLFELDPKRVIDATETRWPAKWINHSCDPNCVARGEGEQIFIDALRTIRPGEELAYDYKITLEERHTPAVKKRYQCLCGTHKCRGTILASKR